MLFGQIAETIEDGLKNDNHAFTEDLLPAAKRILILLENNIQERKDADTPSYNNQATAVLNSTKGKIYSALLNYSLRYARVYKDKKNTNRFDDDIKQLISDRLIAHSDDEHFYHTLGKFLPNLLYLDKDWLKKYINRIFPKDQINLWASAMNGHLYYLTGVYAFIYKMLRSNNHIKKALMHDFEDSEVSTRIVQYVCIAYVNEEESLEDDSMIQWIIKNGQIEQLEDLAQFISIQKDSFNLDSQRKSIIDLLSPLYKSATDRFDLEETKKLFGKLCDWLNYFDGLDQTYTQIFEEFVKYSSIVLPRL